MTQVAETNTRHMVHITENHSLAEWMAEQGTPGTCRNVDKQKTTVQGSTLNVVLKQYKNTQS